MRAPLSKDLVQEYNVRTVSVRKGDTIAVTRGDYKGHEGKVVTLIRNKMRITVDGINVAKMDGTSKPVRISPSKVVVNKLDLSDKRRKSYLEDRAKSKSKE